MTEPIPAPSPALHPGMSRDEVDTAIACCMLADQPRLSRQWRNFRHSIRREPRSPLPDTLLAAIRASQARAAARAAGRPAPTFSDDLPISARREEIAAAIRAHPVVVICGETGSGKSTQLPKICLELGRGVIGMIGHTQPRRLAARTIAGRIAAELGEPPGGVVGCKMRFSDQTGERTAIKVMTDGILLAETQHDRRLLAYDTLIIDEAHERSLNIDFLLGYLKGLLPRRPDLRLIVTSATLDPERFAAHFGGAPIIEVSGRTWPVEIRHRPPEADPDDEEAGLDDDIAAAVRELSRAGRGDILVFLPGEKEISAAAERLRAERLPDTDILPLYARLAAADQQRIFAPHRRRHIVLATNVAETSLTVPGVRYVIDTGLARVSRYSTRTRVQRLPVERISQASAAQRAGRCGRTSDGICIRLWSAEDHAGRPQYTDPEIRRTNLAAIILQLAALDFGAIEEFPFIDPPESRYIGDGYRLLHELGAVDAGRALTPLGRQLARLPVDPRIGRLLLAARDGHCLAELLIIAAALSIQDPRERPHDQAAKADLAHAVYNDPRSDFLWFVNAWQAFAAGDLSGRRAAAWCRERYLSPARMREWRDTHGQLRELVTGMGLPVNREPAAYEAVHQALLAGYLSQIASLEADNTYVAARGVKPSVFPGSVLYRRTPKWLVAAQLVETSRLYLRTVAAVEPEWIERVGAHLLRRSHSEPHWDRRRGRVMAFEKGTLAGLVIYAGRRVDFGGIDPGEARDIFIREALVNGDFETGALFFAHNRRLMEELRVFEHNARRLDILADDQAIFEFYDRRLPENLCDARHFETWILEVEAADPDRLLIPREYLLRAEPAAAALFPDQLSVGGLDLPLAYRFEPGHEEDGVTVTVPALAINQIDGATFDWLVPGMLKEKVAQLIRSLPKPQRRNLVPIQDHVDPFVAAGTAGGADLPAALARHLCERTGVTLRAADFRNDALPDHLRMNFRVIDEQGRLLAAGRDLESLRRQLGGHVARGFAGSVPGALEREGLRRWDFGDLPAAVTVTRNGLALTGYPAIEDCGSSVAIRIVDTAAKAERLSRAGRRRLYMLELDAQMKYLRRNLPDFERMSLHFAGVADAASLREDLVTAICDRAFAIDGEAVRTQADFARRREQGRGALLEVAGDVCKRVAEVLDCHHRLRRDLATASPALKATAAEIDLQLRALVYPGFVSATPEAWFRHLPRYLRAAARRWERARSDPAKDRSRAAQLAPYLEAMRTSGTSGEQPHPVADFRWLVEELRVSLFAQELGTAVPVSAARLDRLLQTSAH